MKERYVVDLEQVLKVSETACVFCAWRHRGHHELPCNLCDHKRWRARLVGFPSMFQLREGMGGELKETGERS
jgi:hypothetical protein